ncbi:ATP-binding protein [Kitasatospora sp. NPDC057692]|uniref:ATP-binding protein n=1 Tax=Kitasatospora sp. NPDC057692 TaxID=3346215 RepID=UPI00369520DE
MNRRVSPMPTHSSSVAVLRTPIAVPRSRRWIQAQVADWRVHLDDCTKDALAVITSELVANAVQHGTGTTLTVGLHIHPVRKRLLIEVHDGSADLPAARSATPDEESGRGFFLVQRLALNHGVERTGHGKRVWAEVELPAQPLTRRQVLTHPHRSLRAAVRRLSRRRGARIHPAPRTPPAEPQAPHTNPTASCPERRSRNDPLHGRSNPDRCRAAPGNPTSFLKEALMSEQQNTDPEDREVVVVFTGSYGLS